MQIRGAVLPKSYEELEEKIIRLSSVCARIQIDLSDGLIGREITWIPKGGDILPVSTKIDYEFDLMVENWREILNKVLLLSPSSVIMHIDSFSDSDLTELAEIFKESGIILGLSVSNDFAISDFIDKINEVRKQNLNVLIQVMGIKNIGEQGQLFDPECLPRIQILKKNFSDIFLQVDGAMRPETVEKVVKAGADGIVVGSYLLDHDDLIQAMSTLSAIE